MRGWWVAAVAAVAGCHHADKHDTEVPLVQEFVAPPAEQRYELPPEQAYRKPAPKKEFKPGFGGGGGGPGGGMPGPGR